MWTIKPPERLVAEAQGPPNLWRTTASVDKLIRTNARLITCFGVAAGILSEGQASAFLGIDRTTLREIFGAAERWAEEIERNLGGDVAPPDSGAEPPAEAGPSG